uniref:otogelin-like n=1 Tax=Oncorhynchus gorbuscha TaxID=8017 RepID=UPI001EAF34B2
ECSVTGDMYFHSFDGRMFTFPASCQYVLAKSRNSGKFTVTIQNAPCGPHLDGSCIQSVSLVIDEDPRTEITLTHLGEVFMAGQYRISLPYSDEVFHIQELSSMYLQVRTALGLHLQYSWREFRLYLQVDELWKGDTVGLCGTFNGNIQDDFLSPSGMIESTPHLFGNAWRVSSACVPSQSVPQLDPCDTHQQAASYASEMCDILNQELFSACHEYLSPVPFHQQCKADTCKCGQPCLCSSLAHYARQCRKYSVITEFRASVPDCDQQCPLGQMYLDCTEGLEGLKAIDGISLGRGLGCEHTCESHLLNLTCSAHEPCIPGCVCPPGLLKHGDECFEPDACPCLWKGKEYYPGDRVTSPCHQCVCQHGTFQCVFRPCPSMCTAYGDRHYRTFDGLLFDYVGVCKVYLVKSSADLMMSVTAENVDCYDSGVICRKSLLINIGRSFIAFDDDSGKPNPSSVIDWRQEVFIWSAGLFTVVHVPEEDLTVLWDRKTTVHIQAGPRWQGKLSGLCGNFDLRTVNEMRTPENIDSATPQEFGNSWTAAECVNSPDIRHPCSLNPLREPFSKRQCGVLLSEVFLVCHPVVDVTWFYMNCLADTCGCSRGGDCECFCTSVAAYAHRCCHQGVTVDWRSPSICPYDCEYYNKVLGKGPYRLVTYRERDTVLAANRSSGTVFPKKGDPAAAGFLSLFMMTPGLSRARPHDTSLVSFEASDRPNYFLAVDSSGHLTLTKWEESEAFWAAATFTLHRDTWIQGYDSLEALARPGFFLHYMLSWIHLMKYKHTDRSRKATLFKLTGPGPDTPTGPKCQWRYELCVSPCFRTCSDPSGEACGTVPKVEGCLPLCPGHMVLDEVTQRCVHVEDCIKPPVAVQPITTVSSVESTPAAVTPSATTTTTRSSPASPGLSTARSTPGPPVPLTTTSIQPPYTTTPSDTVPTTAATTTIIPIVSTLDALTTSAKVPTTVTDKVVLPSTSSAVSTPEGTSAATPSTPSLATAALYRHHIHQPPSIHYHGPLDKLHRGAYPDQRPACSTSRPHQCDHQGHHSLDYNQDYSFYNHPWCTHRGKHKACNCGDNRAINNQSPLSWCIDYSRYYSTLSLTDLHRSHRNNNNTTTTRTHFKTQHSINLTSHHFHYSQNYTVHTPEDNTTTCFHGNHREDGSRLPDRAEDIHNSKTTTEHTTTTTHPTEAVDWRLTTTTGPPTVRTTTTQPITKEISSTTTKPPDLLVTTTESPQITFTSPSISTTTEAVVPTATTLPVSPVSHTETTTTTFTSPSISTTTEAVVPTTTTLPVSTVSHTETTTTVPGPPVAVGAVTTQPPTTLKTTKPWRPPHSETSTTPSSLVSSTERVTTPEVPVKPAVSTEVDVSPHQVFSTTTTDALHHFASSTAPGVTTTTSVTMTTTAKTATAPPETSTGAVSTSRTERPAATPEGPAVPGVPGEPALSLTTMVPMTTVPPLPGIHTTTITPLPGVHTTTITPLPGVPVTTIPPLPGVPVTTVPPLPGVHTTTITPLPGVPVTTVPPLPGIPVTTVPPLPGVPVTTVPPLPGVPVTTVPPLPGVPVTTVPPLPGVPVTTVPPLPGVPVTTAISPVTIRPLTETTSVPPDTGRTNDNNTQDDNRQGSRDDVQNCHNGRSHSRGHAKGHTRCDSSSLSPRLAPHGHPNLHPRAREGGRSRLHYTKDSITITCVSVHHIRDNRVTITCVAVHHIRDNRVTIGSIAIYHDRDNRVTIGSIAIYHDRACWNYGRGSMRLNGTQCRLNGASMELNVCSMGLNPPYSEIIDECTKFLCVSGQLVRFNMSQNCLYNSTPPNCGLLGFAILVNGDKCCPQWDCPCRCSVFPDLNVITFDGNSVAIYKATSYIVTQLPSETVSIVVQECPADSDTLLWNFTNLCLVVLNITHKSNHLVINRLQRRLYVNSRYAKPRFKKFGFEILDTGNMYLIRTPAGLKLQWFHSTGMLVIETESYNSKLPTMGLCGCCDGNPANDLMLSNGTTVGESEDPAVFIDSWQVPNTTSYISHSRRREVNCSTSDCSQCMTMLRNTSFSPCHAFVPPSTFCEVWVRDAEYVNNPCVALAAYVASCHKFNVCMEWRSPDYCPFMCPDRLRYQACLSTCTAQSCSNHDFDHHPEQCTGLTEGCVCPEGTLLHRPYSALCIPPEKCACTDSSGVPRAPGEVWKASKDGCCMYRCDNDSIVPVEYNCSAVAQPLCRRAGEVVIGLADDTSCCPQRACECDPERCESDIPACREDQTLIATRADGSCCLAHICMCGSCLEVVPNCQDGEVLTVDANSTDLCCPVYHCVCEPYRCPELSCPLGMSAVTVSPPDHCCPLHTCECACDKLSKPKCVL